MNADAQPDSTTDDSTVDDHVERLTAYLDRRAARSDSPSTTEPTPDDEITEALLGRLAAAHTWAEPPAGLRDAVLARVRTTETTTDVDPEATPGVVTPEVVVPESVAPVVRPQAVDPVDGPVVGDPGGDHHGPGAVPGRRRWWQWPQSWGRPSLSRLSWAVPVTAVAAAALTVGVVAVDRWLEPDPPPGQVHQATGSQLAPSADARVVIRDMPAGFAIAIDARGLPAAAPGSYYAAWLRGPSGTVPLGSFHAHRTGRPVTLWSGVDPAAYPTLVVTLQAEGEPLTPSELVVLTAQLAR